MITEVLIHEVTEALYSDALRRASPDTLHAQEAARESEERESARATFDLMVRSARLAESNDKFVCLDSGAPTYLNEIRGAAQWQGDIKAAIARGFDHLPTALQSRDEQVHERSPQIMAKLAQRREAAEKQV
jgi:fumarate hydratase subunit alpha